MLTLTIMRHGKAEPHHRADFERELAPKGVLRSRLVAEMLVEAGVIWDCAVTSPAPRASQTADTALDIMTSGLLPSYDRDIYDHADPTTLMSVVRRHAGGARQVVVFGHNPGMSWLAQWLCPDFVDQLATSSAVVLDLEGADWVDVSPGSATLRLVCRHQDHPGAHLEDKP